MYSNIEKTCNEIEKYFYIHKPIKKKVFLSLIKSLLILFKIYNFDNPKVRATIFRLIYIYFREIDDIIDGDKKLISTNVSFYEYKKIVYEYLNDRILYVKDGYSSNNELDEIMKVIFELAEELNLDLRSDFIKLLECMSFDLERKCDLKNGQINFSSNDDIDKYFFQYYYDSCIKIAIMLTAPENIDIKNKNIKDLGYAQRIYFNLEDFFEDLSYGLINISYQDIYKFGISEQSLIDISNLPEYIINQCKIIGFNNPNVSKYIDEPILLWLNEQLDLGIKHLKEYQKTAPLRTLSSITNELLFQRNDLSEIILRVGIEQGTNRYLSKLQKQKVMK